MSRPLFNYHNQKQRWEDFEKDYQELIQNRDKYKGIRARAEIYSFCYCHKKKQKKTLQRLADIYEFKLWFERELAEEKEL